MKILFKYATRSRKNNFFRGLHSIVDNLSNKEDYHILVSMDNDDVVMKSPQVEQSLRGHKNLSYYYGTSQSKIHAINRDMEHAPAFEILVNFSDDQIFTVSGFDDIIRKAMQTHAPNCDGFLHFHDGVQPRLATMSIIGKKIFEEDGYIYHPSYKTEWADNEAQERAQLQKRYFYMGDEVKIQRHINPYHGHPELMDALYKKNAVYSKADQENFFKRKKHNFYL